MKRWIAVILALALLVAINVYISRGILDSQRSEEETESHSPEKTPVKLERATMEPGQVIEMKTSKGIFAFVMFEKDCPVTSARILSLVKNGAYDHVVFPRVEDWLIQTDSAKEDVSGIGIEVLDGLTHSKGAVGMARRGSDYNSNTSVFYILKDPQPSLDGEYTVFGRLILGMHVVLKITNTDYIVSARVRPFTKTDKLAYDEVLKIEAERMVQ